MLGLISKCCFQFYKAKVGKKSNIVSKPEFLSEYFDSSVLPLILTLATQTKIPSVYFLSNSTG